MKTIILAGGLGTRLSEETHLRPKPMVEIGGIPIICHVMGIYSASGYSDFIVAGGYKCEVIKSYFWHFRIHNSDLFIDLGRNETRTSCRMPIDWKVTIIDTGVPTQTGGRVKAVSSLIRDETFMITYGDGLSNIDVESIVRFHKSHGRLATVTAVRPPPRFGAMAFEGDRVIAFNEKPHDGGGWINGGFMVMDRQVLDYIDGSDSSMEKDVLPQLAKDGQLMAYRYGGFWQPMDNVRDKHHLETLWSSGSAPWMKENGLNYAYVCT